jgi:hypothetical protein
METFADEPYAIHRAVIQRFGFSTTSPRSERSHPMIGRHRSGRVPARIDRYPKSRSTQRSPATTIMLHFGGALEPNLQGASNVGAPFLRGLGRGESSLIVGTTE